MIERGSKRLASGVLFSWTHERVEGRGGVFSGSFDRPQTAADHEEAMAVLESLKPAAGEIFMESIGSPSEHAASRQVAFTALTGGSTN